MRRFRQKNPKLSLSLKGASTLEEREKAKLKEKPRLSE